PVLDELAASESDKLTVAKVDVEANQELAAEYQITAIPALLLFSEGKPVQLLTGATSKSALRPELSDILSRPQPPAHPAGVAGGAARPRAVASGSWITVRNTQEHGGRAWRGDGGVGGRRWPRSARPARGWAACTTSTRWA